MASSKAARAVLAADLKVAACPSRGVLDHVTSRWGVLVLVVLQDGTHRFSELRRRIGGVSEKMLAQTLQALEGDGFVLREVFPEIPPRVEYSLTPMGEEIAERVAQLATWIEGNLSRILAARAGRQEMLTGRVKGGASTGTGLRRHRDSL